MSDYTITFNEGTPIWKLYQKLIQDGVKDSDLDNGYVETDYVNKKRTFIVKDGKIQSQEVLDYALERWERYQLAIKETTGYIMPWSFDDLDPATVFDEEIRNKANNAISFFKDELKKADYQEGTDRYQELLALCLFAFAFAPTDGDFSKFTISEGEKVKMERVGLTEWVSFVEEGRVPELETVGLEEILIYLRKHGGLGSIGMNGACELEATALQALEKGCGECTEQSSILYALFKISGLKANFVHGIPSHESHKKLELETGMMHASLGLQLKRGIRFFDLSVKSSSAETFYRTYFSWYFTQTNREFLAGYYNNLGFDYDKKGKLDLAIEEFKKAIEINPDFAEAHNNLGIVYDKKGKLDLAIEEYKKAIEINPDFAETHNNLGVVYMEKREFDLAIEEYKKALEINPYYAEAHNNLRIAHVNNGVINLKKEKLDETIENFSECLKTLPDKRIDDLSEFFLPTLKEKWQSDDDLKKIEAAFSEETGNQLEIAGIEASFIIAASLWKAEKHEQARGKLQIILNVLAFKKNPSPSTKEFFEKMFIVLPDDMRKDKEAMKILEKIKAKLR